MAANNQAANKPANSLSKHDKGYGTPVEGSKTEARAKLAHERISREILDLCAIIYDSGRKDGMSPIDAKNVATNPNKSQETTLAQENTTQTAVAVIDFKRLFVKLGLHIYKRSFIDNNFIIHFQVLSNEEQQVQVLFTNIKMCSY